MNIKVKNNVFVTISGRLLIVLTAALILTGCYHRECGYDFEPEAALYFVHDATQDDWKINDSFNIQLVTGVIRYYAIVDGEDKDFLYPDTIKNPDLLPLPIDLNADKVEYVLDFGNSTDTIEINYNRSFSQDEYCGWTVDFDFTDINTTMEPGNYAIQTDYPYGLEGETETYEYFYYRFYIEKH